MTLAEFALLVGAEPKWVLNAAAVLSLPSRYDVATARRLSIARAVQRTVGIPLPRAFVLAGEALRKPALGNAVALSSPDGSIELRLDMLRLLSEFNVRRSQLATMHAPLRPGPKRSRRRDALRAASDHGIDIGLLRENLRRSPQERLKQLDQMADFARRVQRVVRDKGT